MPFTDVDELVSLSKFQPLAQLTSKKTMLSIQIYFIIYQGHLYTVKLCNKNRYHACVL